MMDRVRSYLTVETGLYLLAFGVALGLRFLSLGQAPLGDGEASLALQAVDLRVPLSPQPGYLLLTSSLFFLFHPSNWLARFWPALAGSLLVFAPYLVRQRIGRAAAVILALFLSFEPVLVSVSRQADGRMIAITLTMISLAAVLLRKTIVAGIAIGLALLGGPSTWLGGLSIALGWFIHYALQPAPPKDQSSLMGAYGQPDSSEKNGWNLRKAAGWAAGTFVVVGSLFFTHVPALGAAAGSLASCFDGFFGRLAGQPVQIVLLAWLISNPLAVVLAISETAQAKRRRDADSLFLAWWWIAALVLVLVYPARQPADLIWPAIPMLVLSARAAARIYHLKGEKRPFFTFAAISIALMLSMWLSLVGAINAWNEAEQGMRLAGMLASFFLLLAAAFLIVWGWGLQIAGRGLRLGATVLLVVFTLASAWKAAGLGTLPETEIWRLDPYPKGADLLKKNLQDFSMWNTGRPDVLDITLTGIESPSIMWAIRDFKAIKSVTGIAAENTSSMVITPHQTELGGNMPYSGQAIAWSVSPDWTVMGGNHWLKWLIFREAPLVKQIIQLWVRTDLFPGGISTK